MSELVSELKPIFEELQSFSESLNKPEIVKPLEALDKMLLRSEKREKSILTGTLLTRN